MAQSSKYGRVTTEFGDIGDDEPVFLIRGRDLIAPRIIDEYARQASFHSSPDRHVTTAREEARRVEQWQADNSHVAPRVAMSESYFARLDSAEADVPSEHYGERNDEES